MNIFRYSSYTDVLVEFLKINHAQPRIKTDFAEATGCKLSYLSHVIAGAAQFTMDHAYGAANFMNFKPIETDYFLLLVQQSRASSKKFKSHLESQIKKLRAENFKIEKEIGPRSELSIIDYETYAMDWLYQAIHVCLTIPKYQRFEALQEKLNLSSEHLRRLLNDMRLMGLAKSHASNGLWVACHRDMHTPLKSHVSAHRHLQWKMRAIQDMQKKAEDSVHYSATFSLSKEDFSVIKADLLKYLQSSRNVALQSPEQIAVHLDVSLFEI